MKCFSYQLVSLVFIFLTPHIVFAHSDISGHISQEINRTVSQSVNKNISDRIVETENKNLAHPSFNSKEGIRETQQMLTNLGYKPGVADGLMGRKTRKAIQSFQKNHKLKVNGKISKDLFHILLKTVNSKL